MVNEHVWQIFFNLYGCKSPIIARKEKNIYSDVAHAHENKKVKKAPIIEVESSRNIDKSGEKAMIKTSITGKSQIL